MKTPRSYQSKAVTTSIARLNEGINKQIICLPTGGGKTFVAVILADYFKRILFCADTEELIEQSAMAFVREKYSPEIASEVEKEGYINYINSHPAFNMGAIKAQTFKPTGNVVVSSVQTLHRRLSKLNPDDFDLIIIDECHIACAPTIVKSINYFKPKLLVGLTATPMRFDNLQLSDIFQEIVFDYSIGDAIKDGYLVEIDGIRIKTNTSLDKVKTVAGDLNQADLSDEVNTPARNYLIANKFLDYTPNRQAIGYCVDIKHAIDLCAAFKEKGINADVVSSNEELTGDRTEKVRLYKEGKIQVLFNVGILTKGFDDDKTSCIIMARPTKSETLYRQMLGRGTRTLKGVIDGINDPMERFMAIKRSAKKDCIILDIVDNTTKHSLINCHELEKHLPPEDRVFITQEKRDKLLLDRAKKSAAKIHVEIKEDERIKLISLPRLKISKSLKMSEDATEAQLKVIERWGYPIKDVHYSKAMISEIFGKQQASSNNIEFLKRHGYDVEGKFVSVAEAQLAEKEILSRKK